MFGEHATGATVSVPLRTLLIQAPQRSPSQAQKAKLQKAKRKMSVNQKYPINTHETDKEEKDCL